MKKPINIQTSLWSLIQKLVVLVPFIIISMHHHLVYFVHCNNPQQQQWQHHEQHQHRSSASAGAGSRFTIGSTNTSAHNPIIAIQSSSMKNIPSIIRVRVRVHHNDGNAIAAAVAAPIGGTINSSIIDLICNTKRIPQTTTTTTQQQRQRQTNYQNKIIRKRRIPFTIDSHSSILQLRGGGARSTSTTSRSTSTTSTGKKERRNDSSSELKLPDLNELDNDDYLDAFVEELIANVDDDDDDYKKDDVDDNEEDNTKYNENMKDMEEKDPTDDEHCEQKQFNNINNKNKDDDDDIEIENDESILQNEQYVKKIKSSLSSSPSLSSTLSSSSSNDQNDEATYKGETKDDVRATIQSSSEKKLYDDDVITCVNGNDSGSDRKKKKKKRKRQRKTSSSLSSKQKDFKNVQDAKDGSFSSITPLSSSREKEKKKDETDGTKNKKQDTKSPITSPTLASDKQQHEEQKQQPSQIQTKIPPPPNPIQRFLLHKGQIGRSITTFTILFFEFLSYYIPPELQSILYLIMNKIIPERIRNHFDNSLTVRNGGRHRQTNGNGKDQTKKMASIPKVNTRYSAFASTSKSIGGKKLTKDQKRKLDQIAMEQLRQISKKKIIKSPTTTTTLPSKDGSSSSIGESGVGIGDYNDGGIYTHLSLRFMKKYNLGHFAKEKKIYDDMIGVLGDDIDDDDREEVEEMDDTETREDDIIGNEIKQSQKDTMKQNEVEDDDDDDDWVAQAFLLDTNDDDNELIGIDDFYGDYEKDREMRKNLDIIEAAYASKDQIVSSSSSKNRKKKRKQSKDSKDFQDGNIGSGASTGSNSMFGRLRAAAETNGVTSRRIFGAYPGDAAAIEDAASANGVIELATKYGYGDWSEDSSSEDVEDDYMIGGSRRKRRHTKKKKRKKVKLSGSRRRTGGVSNVDNKSKGGLTFSVELGGKKSSSTRSSPGIKRGKKKKSSSSSRSEIGSKQKLRTKRTTGEIGIVERRSHHTTDESVSSSKVHSDSLASRQRNLLQSGLKSRSGIGTRKKIKKKKKKQKRE